MKRKVLLLALCLSTVLTTSGIAANAADLVHYSGYVKKTQDIVTGTLKKETTAVGTNWVEHVEGNRKLTCWIQKSGSRVTNTKSYTDSGYQKMTYNDPVNANGQYLSLAVSTALTTVQTTYSFGSWSPDDVQ